MMDADMKEITECFSASPVSADVDAARLWRAIQSIRKEEREACAAAAKSVQDSYGRHPQMDEISKVIAQQVAVLIEAAILQRGE